MRTRAIVGLLAAFSACSDSAELAPRPAIGDPGSDVTTATEPDAGTVVATSCSEPLAPVSCSSLGPAPATAAAIESFVKASAVPLRCGEHESAVWDVRPLVDLYGSQKVFMMGEVHGTNEIGIMSSILFEQLAKKSQVNVLAFELPMEFGERLSRWVATGDDPIAEQWIASFAPNMFANILTRTARDLVKQGFSIRLVAVDCTYDSQLPIAALEEIAAKLTTQKSTVLDTLPSDPPSKTAATEYFDHIMASKAAICAELTAADCDRLDAMTHALWVSAFVDGDMDELWFSRREEVIYYNMKSAIQSSTDRMFVHMGSAHTNKHERSAGSRMAHEYERTKDSVFSVAPAFGDGSVSWYGSGLQDLTGTPSTITSALTHAPPNPLFVSTTRPSATCEANPLGLEDDDPPSTGHRAEAYDGYIHYGKLTSERSPEATTFDRGTPSAGSAADPSLERLRAIRARVDAKEHAALKALARRGQREPAVTGRAVR